MKTKLCGCLIALALLAGFAPNARAAVTFTNTPAVVGNTYNGLITLQIGGLTNTETVVVQEYLDANTNGVIDAGDILWQQFRLTDGQQSIFHNGSTVVTNFNVPGDTDGTANGTITAKINFLVNSPVTIAGKYEVKLSSPVGHFTPITNLFTVTNFPYAQAFTGNVVSNGTSTTLSNAVVLLFDATGQNLNVVGGALANNAGSYTVKAPPGTYTLAAFKSNYVASTTAAANLVLGAGVTNSLNVSLLSTTQSISGRVVDANNSSLGIAGFLVPVQTQSGLLTVAFTDTNGNFTARVNANQWGIEGNEQGLMAYGYLGLQNNTNVDTTGGSVSGVTNALPKATAVFYGSVKDNLNHPLAGISLYSQQQDTNQYDAEGITDTNGNYVAGALAGDWNVGVSNDSNPTNYVFSQGNGTILTNGQAYLQNFTAYLATNHITGHVSFNGTPVTNVQVSANANIGSNNYQAQGDTDGNGNYSLNVVNTNDWNVSVSCNGGDNSLDNSLGSGNYQCPDGADVTISNNNGTANFIVLPPNSGQIFGYVTNTSGNPVIGVNVYANDGIGDIDTNATDGSGHYSFVVGNGNWDVSVDCGGLNLLGYQCVGDQMVNVSDDSVEQDFAVQIGQPVLSAPVWLTNRFSLQLVGAASQNYTVQMSTNLSSTNWISLFVTNNPATNSFILTDPNATNKQRFYRILIGP